MESMKKSAFIALKRREIEEHFSKLEDNAKNGAEKILARQNTPICKMLEEKNNH